MCPSEAAESFGHVLQKRGQAEPEPPPAVQQLSPSDNETNGVFRQSSSTCKYKHYQRYHQVSCHQADGKAENIWDKSDDTQVYTLIFGVYFHISR